LLVNGEILLDYGIKAGEIPEYAKAIKRIFCVFSN
jgi:hypothetical protein